MNDQISRRDYLRMLGMSGLAVGTGAIASSRVLAQNVGESSGFQSSVIARDKVQPNRSNAVLIDGEVIQPQRRLPVLAETDVLVVGGGPAVCPGHEPIRSCCFTPGNQTCDGLVQLDLNFIRCRLIDFLCTLAQPVVRSGLPFGSFPGPDFSALSIWTVLVVAQNKKARSGKYGISDGQTDRFGPGRRGRLRGGCSTDRVQTNATLAPSRSSRGTDLRGPVHPMRQLYPSLSTPDHSEGPRRKRMGRHFNSRAEF